MDEPQKPLFPRPGGDAPPAEPPDPRMRQPVTIYGAPPLPDPRPAAPVYGGPPSSWTAPSPVRDYQAPPPPAPVTGVPLWALIVVAVCLLGLLAFLINLL